VHSASTTTLAQRAPSVGADAKRLPKAWKTLPAAFFKPDEGFPNVLLSYQSDSTGEKGSGVGKAWMWAMANGFRAANITSFNGCQVGPNTPVAYHPQHSFSHRTHSLFTPQLAGHRRGELATGMVRCAPGVQGARGDAEQVVLRVGGVRRRAEGSVLSRQAHDSGPYAVNTAPVTAPPLPQYVSHLGAALELWPLTTLACMTLSAQIYLEDVDIDGRFFGTSPEQIKTANFIRTKLDGNCVPPPDQGFFQGRGAADFQKNMERLVEVVKDKYLS
jgi:hypothetical protein